MIAFSTMDSPVKRLFIAAEDRGLIDVSFLGERSVAGALAGLARRGFDTSGAVDLSNGEGPGREGPGPEEPSREDPDTEEPDVEEPARKDPDVEEPDPDEPDGGKTGGGNRRRGSGISPASTTKSISHVTSAVRQLRSYFSGASQGFDLDLYLVGTDFQEAIWRALAKIPFGETCTYGDLAKAVGRPKAVRAVGGAVGDNPVAIVLPCHRVIGANGALTGFGGGLHRKRWLLGHESGDLFRGARDLA